MRFPGFFFGGGSFGRGRRPSRRSAHGRRRHGAAHRLGGESLESRAVLAVVVPAPIITSATDGTNPLRTGGVTNAASLMLSGTAAANVTSIDVYNGNTKLNLAPITLTPGTRTWTYSTSPDVPTLPGGIYNFRARATIGSTTSPASARPFVVTVDTVAPAAPTISHVLDDRAPVVGTVPRNGTTNDRTLTLTGTAEPGSRVTVSYGTQTGVATLVGSTWRFTTAPITPDGIYAFTATATDKAGNTSLVGPAYTVTVDTDETMPTIGWVDDNVGIYPGNLLVNPLFAITDDPTLELRGTADTGSTVTIFDGTTPVGTAVANATRDWTFTTRPLTDGQVYRFSAQATDPAGNTRRMPAPVIPIRIDTTPPRPVITDVKTIGGTPIANRGVTNQTSLTIFVQSEPGSLVDVYDPVSGPLPLPGCPIPIPPSGVATLAVAGLSDAVHDFRITSVDAAGNASVLPSVTYTVTVDTMAPQVAILSVIDDALPGVGVVLPGGSTNDRTLTLTGTTDPGSTVKVEYSLNSGPPVSLGTARVTGSTWRLTTAPLPSDGVYVFTATATDLAQNTSGPTVYTVTLDTTAAFSGFGPLPAPGVYGLGNTLSFYLDFSPDLLVVDTTGGVPRIPLNTIPQRYAVYDPIATGPLPASTLVFSYTPQLGDRTSGNLDFSPAVIDLNGGTIRDLSGNDVTPALGPGGSFAGQGITVDAKLTILALATPPNTPPVPATSGPGPTLTGPLPTLTIQFNAPLTRDLTVDSFDLFLEDRSMSTEGVIIAKLADDTYSLTLPPATHQSLRGRYRLDIGGPGSGIESGGVLMDTVVSLYWQL